MTHIRRHAAAVYVASVLLVMAMWSADARSQEVGSPDVGRQPIGIDASSSVVSRISEVPPEIINRYLGVTNHALTSEQRQEFVSALDVLTPLHRTIIQEHLRSISFADGLPANAQTVRVTPSGPEPAFNLVINSRVLDETLSEFATRKERQLFETADSQMSVAVVAGSMDAVAFVLAHEATHMVDMVLLFTPTMPPAATIQETDHTPISRGVWETAITPASAYRGEVLDSIPIRTRGKPLDIENARKLYEDLERTPFVSVYASLMVAEDIAELVAWRQMTEKFGQPYRIEVRDETGVIYSYEPMQSPLVRSRLSQLGRFDSPEK